MFELLFPPIDIQHPSVHADSSSYRQELCSYKLRDRHIYIYICLYHRTLPALPHDCLSPLEPGTKFWISARWRRVTKTPRAHQGVLLGREAGVRALRATCVQSPCASKFSGNPRRSLFGGGALPERNVFEGWHREQEPGGENYYYSCDLFSVREDPNCIRKLVCAE